MQKGQSAPRTYDHNGHTDMPMSFPDVSDREMAGMVRMLMRNQLDHEAICVGARDRILTLTKERDAAIAKVEQLKSQDEYLRCRVGKPINPRAVIGWLREATLLTPERSSRPQLGDVVIDVTSEPIIPDRIGELRAIEEGPNGPVYVVWCSEPREDGRKNFQTWEDVEIRTIMITPNTLIHERIRAEAEG